MRYFLSSFLFFILFTTQAQIDYRLSMTQPKTHYFEVEMHVKNIKGREFEVKMPVWAPGSYLVRDFSKSVNKVYAYDEKGVALAVEKVFKNAWKITNGSTKNVKVKYSVYAFEQSVRTSYLDENHGFVSGTSVFMYSEQFRNEKGRLTIVPHSTFSRITTGLSQTGETVSNDNATSTFKFDNYDQLADSPIEIGNQTVFEFTASGCKHVVALYGKANYDINRLRQDMAKIVDAATSIFGENPNKKYAFIIHNVNDAQGGLEHTNSTTLSVNRFTYSPENYTKFMTLVAHEYFHLWNVKRLRAKALGPFDYDHENYTPLLYVMEGFTSFYEDLIVYKAGFTTEGEFLNTIQGAVNYVENSPGARVQSLAEASFDAWIKAYKPTENSPNTTISYYSGGGIIATLMDAIIIDKFQGKKTLDDFMRVLYQKYYKEKSIGFTEKQFEEEFSKFIGSDQNEFFAKYVRGTEIPDFKSILGKIGIQVVETPSQLPNAGISVGGGGEIRYVRSNSAAEEAGLSPNDEILAVNGFRTKGSNAQSMLDGLAIGEKATVLYARDNVIQTCEITGKAYHKISYGFSLPENASNNNLIRAFFRAK